jgi:hypothetical protein
MTDPVARADWRPSFLGAPPAPMHADKPRRAWYSRKRVWAAIVLLLVIAYPMSAGPVAYLGGRGWLPGYTGKAPWPPGVAFYAPLILGLRTPPGQIWDEYVRLCERTGRRHAASD